MGLANSQGGLEFDCTCNTANNEHHRDTVNSPTPFCSTRYRSSIERWGNNHPLFSTRVFHILFFGRWAPCRLNIVCISVVFFRLEKNAWGTLHIPAHHCLSYPNHNSYKMQLLFYFLWSLLCRIVGIALNFHLQLFDANHWGISHNQRQIYRRRIVDTRHSL